MPPGFDAFWHANATANKNSRRVGGEHPIQSVRFLAINRQAVLLANANHQIGKPALVPDWESCSGITSAFLSAIHYRTSHSQIQEVGGESPTSRDSRGTQPAVMGIRPRNDVFDFGFPPARKRASGIRTPNPSKALDNPCFNRLWIGIIRGLVRATTVFWNHAEAPPRLCRTSPRIS